MIQEVVYQVMICMIDENMVMETELEDMIQTDKEVMMEKHEVLVDMTEKQEVMIKEIDL